MDVCWNFMWSLLFLSILSPCLRPVVLYLFLSYIAVLTLHSGLSNGVFGIYSWPSVYFFVLCSMCYVFYPLIVDCRL